MLALLLSVIILITVFTPQHPQNMRCLGPLLIPLLHPLSQMLSQETSCNIQGNFTVKPVLTLMVFLIYFLGEKVSLTNVQSVGVARTV